MFRTAFGFVSNVPVLSWMAVVFCHSFLCLVVLFFGRLGHDGLVSAFLPAHHTVPSTKFLVLLPLSYGVYCLASGTVFVFLLSFDVSTSVFSDKYWH